MKNLYCLTAIMFLSFLTAQNKPVDLIGVKGPLKFNQTDFHFAWSQRPNVDYYVQEYLPKGESLATFNQLLTVNVFVMDISVEDAVAQKVAELEKRKETDKVCNYSVTQSPDKKQTIVDCIMTLEKNGELTVAEFIIYRYLQIELENNQKAILVYSYSKRSYEKEILAFFIRLKKDRINLLNAMISTNLPKIKIKE